MHLQSLFAYCVHEVIQHSIFSVVNEAIMLFNFAQLAVQKSFFKKDSGHKH